MLLSMYRIHIYVYTRTYTHSHVNGMTYVPFNTSSNHLKNARPNTSTHFCGLTVPHRRALTCLLNAGPQGFWGFALQIHIYLHLLSIHLVTFSVYGTSPKRALHACWPLGLIGLMRVRPIWPCCLETRNIYFPQPFSRKFFPYFNKKIFLIL